MNPRTELWIARTGLTLGGAMIGSGLVLMSMAMAAPSLGYAVVGYAAIYGGSMFLAVFGPMHQSARHDVRLQRLRKEWADG